jgi:threonine aldolase
MTQQQTPLDYRSDTLTQPTPQMRAAMASAEVGDDVFAEDPSVNKLQQHVAQLLGKEAALFVPSGTMSNQIGVLVHCQGGDEFLCETGCHIYNYEQGAFAQLGGVVARTVDGREGLLDASQLVDKIRPTNAHLVRTRLVCLENTHNMAGGRIHSYDQIKEICRWAHSNNLICHLDGARLMNAVVATGIPASQWAQHFDTVSICFSKGLGAPVGSALVGDRTAIEHAHRKRKLLGGGMRQAGVLAAAADHALTHHVERLAEDHVHAKSLAAGLASIEGLQLAQQTTDTNIVLFQVDPAIGTAAEFVAELANSGVQMLAVAQDRVRAVTHLDVSHSRVTEAIETVQRVLDQLRQT